MTAALKCRKCKRSLVEALAIAFCRRAVKKLRNGQVLVLTGCVSSNDEDYGWELTAGDVVPKVTKQFTSNAPEADMRVWRHALQSQHDKILIYSPDTDVFNVGLTLLKPGCHYMTQINQPQYPPRYINVNKLLHAFETDPDLASVQRNKLGSIMQQLYVCTGCDYVSYVAGIGKAMFLNCFFQHADFVTGMSADGDLSMTNDTNMNIGFLSLIRLFGTVYFFKKHLATIVSRLGFDTPTQLFNSIPDQGTDREGKHKQWYMLIRGVIPVLSEDQRPPTLTALWRHWMRSSWINKMWANSPKADLYSELAPPESQGWIKDETTTEWNIDWEAVDVQQRITRTIDFLRKGCGCKTGCRTNRCGCRKNGRLCGAGCECRECTNMHSTHLLQDEDGEEEELEEEEVRE